MICATKVNILSLLDPEVWPDEKESQRGWPDSEQPRLCQPLSRDIT